MDLRHIVSADHANIREIADQIRRSAGTEGPTGRDSLFDQFDDELRRHMMLMETVVMPAAGSDSGVSGNSHDTHRDLMQGLDALGPGDRGSAEWTGRFEAFTDELDRIFGEHMQLVASLADSDGVARRYQRAKLKALRTSSRPMRSGWLVGIGVGMAATALTALAMRQARRRRGGLSTAGDIEPTRRRLVRVRTVVVQPVVAEPPLTATL